MSAKACVVVPVHRIIDRLYACMRALGAQTVRSSLEIIISLDGEVPLPGDLEAMADRVVRGPKTGPAGARNRGYMSTDTRFVLFTDADCVPEPAWAETMISRLEAGADGVKGVYSGGGRRLIQRLAQVDFEERYRMLARVGRIDMVDTYSAGFSRSALERATGFNEEFPVADSEDVDLSYRMVAMGMNLVFEPAARVGHEHRATWAEYFRLKVSRGRWRLRVLRSHPGKAVKDSYTPMLLRLQVMLAAGLPAFVAGGFLHHAVWIAWPALFLCSALPLMLTAMGKDPRLVPIVPVFIFVRGFALALGSIRGILEGRVAG
jgi:GT2 family glycosyltransferase